MSARTIQPDTDYSKTNWQSCETTEQSPHIDQEYDSLKKRIARKMLLDRILAAVALLPAFPLIAILWGLVRLTSRGPGIYCQRRVGLNGREFSIIKLRTMTTDCERETGAVWARANDPRVTWLGKWLRATHLDELPQLFNVVRGEMALVGPRPERAEIITRLLPDVPNYLERLRIPPGVTGLAQICVPADRTIDDVRAKVRQDLRYLRTMSLWLDFRIVICTALKVVGLNSPLMRQFLRLEPRVSQRQHGAGSRGPGGIVVMDRR